MMRDKRIAYALLAYALGLLLLVLPRCARAEEAAPACRQVGAEVICPIADFDRLVHLVIDAREALAVCQAQLADCQNKPPPVCIPTPLPPPLPPPDPTTTSGGQQRPSGAALTAVGLAVVSGAAVVAGALLDRSPTDRAALVGGGLLGIGVATLIVTW